MVKTEILISENLPNFLHTTNEGSVMSTLLKHLTGVHPPTDANALIYRCVW